MKALLAEIRRRDRLLFLTGWAHVVLAAFFVVGLQVDQRTVLGISPWIKPLKFALSITLYVWTIAWFLGHVRAGAPRLARFIGAGTSLSMLVEIACIAGQSLRGVPSHFNGARPVDAAVFALMGLMILLNSLLAAVLLALLFRVDTGLPRPYLWGIRLGLAVMLMASAEGGLMVALQRHTVGAPDGGPGLPFVNWSTRAGDLRVSHFMGLHALQLLPLLGALLSRWQSGWSEGVRVRAVLAAAVVYGAAFTIALAWALSGRPVLRL